MRNTTSITAAKERDTQKPGVGRARECQATPATSISLLAAGNMAVQRRFSLPIVQRPCSCGGTSGSGGECAECKAKSEAGAESVQRESTHRDAKGANDAPAIVHDVLKSTGKALDSTTRTSMEPHFGQDFSGVRVHTDAKAAESARAVHAHAYTVGNNVVFGSGKYAPGTSAGSALLAHELTHVVQQSGASGGSTEQSLKIGAADDVYEQEADRASNAIGTTSGSIGVQKSETQVSRQQDPPGAPAAPAKPAGPVYLCSKNLDRSPVGTHCFFRFGSNAKGNHTYSLEPVDRGGNCWQGEPKIDFSSDVNAEAKCEVTTLTEPCLTAAFAAYPIGHYCTFGPNSNTFVGHLARTCGMAKPDPSGYNPGIDRAPPPAGTFAASPDETLWGCKTKTCNVPQQSQSAGPANGANAAGSVAPTNALQRQEVPEGGTTSPPLAGPAGPQASDPANPNDAGTPANTVTFKDVTLAPEAQYVRTQLQNYIAQNGEDAAQDFVNAFGDDLSNNRANRSDTSGVTEESAALNAKISLEEQIKPLLDSQLAVIRQENQEYLQQFETHAKLVLGAMLSTSEERITAERDRYGLTQTRTETQGRYNPVLDNQTTIVHIENKMANNTATGGLTSAAKALEDKVVALRAAVVEQNGLVSVVVSPGTENTSTVISDQARYDQLGRQIDGIQHDYALLRNDKERDYPILASYAGYENLGTVTLDSTIDKLKSIAAGPSTSLAGTFNDDITDKLNNINTVWANLNSGDLKVWKLPSVINLTEQQMGVDHGSMHERLINDKIATVVSTEAIISIALGVIALALGALAAIPTGGSSLAAAGTFVAAGGAAGIGTYVAAAHLHDYILDSAANGTDFDKARAVSQDDPSLFWLALDIVSAALDIHAAADAFRTLSTTARAAMAARRAAHDAAGIAEAESAAAKLSQDAEKLHAGLGERVASDLTHEAGKIGEVGEQGLMQWEGTLNQETRNLLVDKPELKTLYAEMDPTVRSLFTHCASVCIIPSATRQDVHAASELLGRLKANGVQIDEDLLARLQIYFHLQSNDLSGALRRLEPGPLQRGVSTAEELDNALTQAFRRRAMEPPGGSPGVAPTIARNTTGTVTGGTRLPYIANGQDWLHSTGGGVGLIPKQIGDKLLNRTFNSFDDMRAEFWRLVADDPALSKGFSAQNLEYMKSGGSAASNQALGGRFRYDLHHITPIEHGGAVYDLDNLAVVSPEFHDVIHN